MRSRKLGALSRGWFSRPKLKRSRYITKGKCRCGRPATSGFFVRRHNGPPVEKTSRFYHHDSDVYVGRTGISFNSPVIDCASCGTPRNAYPVRGIRNPAVRCDARCTQAKGFSCECSCGGKNHGAGFSA